MALSKKIVLGDFQPDADPQDPGVLTDMSNLIGTTRGLRVLPGFRTITPPIPNGEVSIGAYNAILFTGDRETYVGTAQHLYLLQQDVWVEWDSGQTYQDGGGRWRFTVYGNDVLAVNGVNEPQISIDGAQFINISAAPGFTGLPPTNSAPIASIVETTDFGVMLVGTASATWYASALSDVLWAPSIAQSVATAQLTATPGPITALHRLRGGVAAYKEQSLYFGQFTGPPFLWSFVSISEQVGTPSNESVVNVGDQHYFLGTDDFYVFDGSTLARVPNNVKDWFFERVDQRYIGKILGQYDRINATVFWHFPTLQAFQQSAAAPGTLNEWLAYNTRTHKWTKGSNIHSVTVQDVVTPDVPAVMDLTYEEFAAKYQTYDGTDDLAYNDPSFSADGDTVMAVITSTGQLATLDGPPMPSYLVTGEFGDGDHFYQVDEVRPIFAVYPSDQWGRLVASYSMINGYPRPDPHDFPAPYIGPLAWLTKGGSFYFIQNARAHVFRIEFTGMVEITGLEVSSTDMGTN